MKTPKKPPTAKSLLGEAMKAMWATPKFRKKMIAAKATPEAQKQMRDARKAEWLDPEIRAKRGAGMRKPKRKRLEKERADA